MDIETLENIIKNYTDKSRYTSGFVAYKNNLVRNSYVKKENNLINMYATVHNEIYTESHTTLIMLNDKTHRIINGSCDCNDWLSKSTPQKTFLCKHMVATIFKCISNLNNKQNLKVKLVNKVDIKQNILKNQMVIANLSEGLGNSFKLSFSIGDIDKKEYKNIFKSFKEKKRLHRLPDNNYLDLNDSNLKELLNLIDILGVSDNIDNINISSSKAIYLDKLINQSNLDFIQGKEYLDKITKRFNANIAYKIPTELNAKLRDYQIGGFKWFKSLSHYEFGGILADEMGLGKTIQAITFILSNKNKTTIVVTPTSLIHNWKYEFEKFAPTLKVGLAHGDKRNRDKIINNYKSYDVILTTYGTIKNDLEQYRDKAFDYCIIDEAQNIKNPDALVTKSLKIINSKVKFALTGTPIENNILELWSIFDFIMPGYLYNKQKFQSIFINDEKNINELKKLINPFMLRRTKKEVIKELPDKIEKKFFIELNSEQRKIYDIYNKSVLEKIKASNHDKITIFSYLTKLRQLCLDPGVLIQSYNGNSSKTTTLLELLKEAIEDKRKILVFSQYTTILKNISKVLEDESIKYSYLDGKTKASDRLKLVEEFNNSRDLSVFLISLKAGGTGLNITSSDLVIHFDPWWNPAVENQASDRAHRLGQENTVEVIKLIAKDTIEEKIIALQEDKKELINNIVNNDLSKSNTLSNLTKEQLIDLFK